MKYAMGTACCLLLLAAAGAPAAAGPLDNAEEFMQSRIDLQAGEAARAPSAKPVIEREDDTPPADGSTDTRDADPSDPRN